MGNTQKGVDALSRISGSMAVGDSSHEKVVPGNPALVRPVQPFVERGEFLSALATGASIPEMMRRWDFEPTRKQKIISGAKAVVKRLIGRR